MDVKMVYEYQQMQELNDEYDRFNRVWMTIKNIMSNRGFIYKTYVPIDQVILISSINKDSDKDEFIGLIQTLKKYLDDNVIDKMKHMK